MKDKKRLFISIFAMVLLPCFILAACNSNHGIRGKAITGNTPSDPSIKESSLTGKENILSNTAPAATPGDRSKAGTTATPGSQNQSVPATNMRQNE